MSGHMWASEAFPWKYCAVKMDEGNVVPLDVAEVRNELTQPFYYKYSWEVNKAEQVQVKPHVTQLKGKLHFNTDLLSLF